MDEGLGNGKRKTEAQVVFLKLFIICSSYKRLFVDEGTNKSYPFAKGLNGLNRLNGLN
jgi:hypothetical protein